MGALHKEKGVKLSKKIIEIYIGKSTLDRIWLADTGQKLETGRAYQFREGKKAVEKKRKNNRSSCRKEKNLYRSEKRQFS